jgi:predicted ATP-grasp superfamily ATP-dependent carboligase
LTRNPPPALALGFGVTLLGVTRILGRQGLPRRASVSKDDFVATTRWLPRNAHLPPVGPASGLAAYLEALPLEQGVVIACSDELALATAELPAPVAERFPSFQPDASVLRLLVDKGAFLRTLATLGVPHPRTLVVERPEDLESVSDAELETAFIKPRDSQRFQRELGVKGLRPTAREDFRATLAELLAAGHGVMVQEYVPGPASNHYFVDGFTGEGGEILTLLARRRLRMYPADFGNSTFMVSVPPEEAAGAVASLRHLLGSLGYRGIFSAEFKRDERDGEFRIIEINARPWWYVEFAARAGMDVVRLAYRAALGLPVDPPKSYQLGRTMMYPYYDFHACRALVPGKAAAVCRFLVDLVGADQPLFCADDPGPALRHWARAAPGIIARRLPGLHRRAAH